MPERGSLSLESISCFPKGHQEQWLWVQERLCKKPCVQWFCSQADLKCFFAFCFSFFLSKELAEVTQERSTLPGPAELAAEHHGPF